MNNLPTFPKLIGKKFMILILLQMIFVVVCVAQQKVLGSDEINKIIDKKYNNKNKKIKTNNFKKPESEFIAYTKEDLDSLKVVEDSVKGEKDYVKAAIPKWTTHFNWLSDGRIKVNFGKITDKFEFKDIYISSLSETKNIKYQLPENILKKLSTFELFKFCVGQPYYTFMSSSLEVDYLKDFNGYVELLSRKDFPDILFKKLEFYDRNKKYDILYYIIITFLGQNDLYKRLNNYQKIKIYNSLLLVLDSHNVYTYKVANFVTNKGKTYYVMQDQKWLPIFVGVFAPNPRIKNLKQELKKIILKELEKLKNGRENE